MSPRADTPRRGTTRDRAASIFLGVFLLVPGAMSCGARPSGARALPALPRGVQVHASELRYEVAGASVDDIGRSLRRRGREALGDRITGRHEWRMRWNYTYRQVGGTCEVTGVAIELHSEIILPRWKDRTVADSTLTALWDTYIADLRRHEYGHRLHSYRAARELSREVTRIRAPACGMLSLRVGITAQEILDRYKTIDVEFDTDPANVVRWPPREEAGPHAF